MEIIKCDSCKNIIEYPNKYVKLTIETKYLSAVDRYSITNDNDINKSMDLCGRCFDELMTSKIFKKWGE